MKELKKHLTWYRLRDPGRPDYVYGDEIADEQLAFRRAAKLAGFYQQPIEVCKVVGGNDAVQGESVETGPSRRKTR